VFTSGATESNNVVITGFARRHPHSIVVVSQLEHPSILNPIRYLERTRQITVAWIPVTREGIVTRAALRRVLQSLPKTATLLVTVMLTNHEIGTIQDLRSLVREAHRFGALFHSDITQCPGKMPVNLTALEVDSASFSAHKFYGPVGVGGLFLKQGVQLDQLTFGGNQELFRRPGTENVVGIVGMCTALEYVTATLPSHMRKYAQLKRCLFEELARQKIHVAVLGAPQSTLSQTATIALPDADSHKLIAALSDRGIFISSGSACKASSTSGSNVLSAIGLPRTYGVLRVGFGHSTTRAQLKRFVQELKVVLPLCGHTISS
jgi:cysteine desulfurase